MQSIDASDILAPSELENSDLLKTDDFTFDLASKSLLFMSSSTANGDFDFSLPHSIASSSITTTTTTNSTATTSNINNTSANMSSISKLTNSTGKF